MTYADRAAKRIDSHSTWNLARFADVAAPDKSTDSPGADFLRRVRDDVSEHIRDVTDKADLLRFREGDAPHEIADSAVPIYNTDRWAAAGDLCAWQEDVSEYGEPEDLMQAVSWALYAIALRLVDALVEDACENVEDR